MNDIANRLAGFVACNGKRGAPWRGIGHDQQGFQLGDMRLQTIWRGIGHNGGDIEVIFQITDLARNQ